MPETNLWGDTVEVGSFCGHPGLVYRDRPTTIMAALRESRRWSDRPFIRHGATVVTFAEHEQMVHRFAQYLRSKGVERGDRIGIYASNSPQWVGMFFAILDIGAIVVPCNGWWSAEEMANACEIASPVIVVTDERRSERVPGFVTTLMLPSVDDVFEALDSFPAPDGSDTTGEDDPAVILFTAGTTNFPKGAVLTHRALVANLQTLMVVAKKLPTQITDDNPASVALVGLPLFHIGAIQLILFPLMTGSEIVFLEGRFDPKAVLSLIESRKVTMFSGVPTMMERILGHEDLPLRDVKSLRTVVLGGAPVDDALLARVKSAFPSTRRGVGQTYGLTEAGGVVSTGVGAEIASHPGSSGRLAPVVEARVDNADSDGNGELLIRSPAGMDGYWGAQGDDTIDADGWIRTGDLGHVDADRFLYITGRAKDVIIRGGENIAPARVEEVLRAHPAVREVSVIGLPDSDLGEIVAAVVRLEPGAAPSVSELGDFAALRLAHFAVPSRWWMRDEPLPTNDSGKVLKRVLVEQWNAEATAPDGDYSEALPAGR
ncbi:class I adenylate-forming enzyme family protein [Rhodococcus sp. P1Y]|uniref:class I adenylate-forming enzyme family protein n=1 Tax=Rhodococcus sp. P1Y TaxID=1302308 RepID=UPI00137A4774|nr:class I adenylate-forming enzyme family protein [Rhodococcus sp. P1Y]